MLCPDNIFVDYFFKVAFILRWLVGLVHSSAFATTSSSWISSGLIVNIFSLPLDFVRLYGRKSVCIVRLSWLSLLLVSLMLLMKRWRTALYCLVHLTWLCVLWLITNFRSISKRRFLKISECVVVMDSLGVGRSDLEIVAILHAAVFQWWCEI